MKSRLYQPKKKTPDEQLQALIKKIEKDDIKLIKCEIPGKDDGVFHYQRPWKL